MEIFRHLADPMLFQGEKRSKPYFEGWYFRQVTADLKKTFSVIPGISRNNTDSHAFIQTIYFMDETTQTKAETHYHRFPLKDFHCADDPFRLKIGENEFWRQGFN